MNKFYSWTLCSDNPIRDRLTCTTMVTGAKVSDPVYVNNSRSPFDVGPKNEDSRIPAGVNKTQQRPILILPQQQM